MQHGEPLPARNSGSLICNARRQPQKLWKSLHHPPTTRFVESQGAAEPAQKPQNVAKDHDEDEATREPEKWLMGRSDLDVRGKNIHILLRPKAMDVDVDERCSSDSGTPSLSE